MFLSQCLIARGVRRSVEIIHASLAAFLARRALRTMSIALFRSALVMVIRTEGGVYSAYLDAPSLAYPASNLHELSFPLIQSTFLMFAIACPWAVGSAYGRRQDLAICLHRNDLDVDRTTKYQNMERRKRTQR